ncbi:hypothetical protein K432DRAFT_399035 [Lepidopterella palustris CBS 459.81]|uniref:Uncharacterized protein n=1 Tax=Lepidopterella palustris CBS 459.81 TaxID=1314670 RepID=A0A8E2DX62_9PEZI|nr:hypothetical protein K432DRAFT_399035 [Lepidopterella palustris CBS 459.81]
MTATYLIKSRRDRVKKINSFLPNDYENILGLPNGKNNIESVNKAGARQMVFTHFSHFDSEKDKADARQANQRIIDSAKAMRANQHILSAMEVYTDGGVANVPSEYKKPPRWVQRLYREAAPLVAALTNDRFNQTALNKVKEINERIETNSTEESDWTIRIEQILVHIGYAWEGAQTFDLEKFQISMRILHAISRQHYYPWTYNRPRAPWISKTDLQRYAPDSKEWNNIKKSLALAYTEPDKTYIHEIEDTKDYMDIENVQYNTEDEILEDALENGRENRVIAKTIGVLENGQDTLVIIENDRESLIAAEIIGMLGGGQDALATQGTGQGAPATLGDGWKERATAKTIWK